MSEEKNNTTPKEANPPTSEARVVANKKETNAPTAPVADETPSKEEVVEVVEDEAIMESSDAKALEEGEEKVETQIKVPEEIKEEVKIQVDTPSEKPPEKAEALTSEPESKPKPRLNPLLKSAPPPLAKQSAPTPVKVIKERVPEDYCSEKGFWGRLKELSTLGVAKRKKIREDNLNKIINSFTGQDKITNNAVEELLGVSDRTACRYLKALVKEKKMAKFGQKHNTFYRKYV